MTVYRAHATWDDTGWWIVTVLELGPAATTQCRRLDQASDDIAEVVTLLTGDELVEIELDWDDIATSAAVARQLRREAERIADDAKKATRTAVHELRDAGLSYRDIGTMTGISHQRVQQLIKG